MEQITTSLAARNAQKSTVSGAGSDAAGSVTKRFFPFLMLTQYADFVLSD
jgi:hypothetical protein